MRGALASGAAWGVAGEEDTRRAAGTCIAAVDRRLASGRGCEALALWGERIDGLLCQVLPASTRAALLLRRGLIHLVAGAEGEVAAGCFRAGLACCPAADLGTRIALQALAGLCDCLAGAVVRADVLLADNALLRAADPGLRWAWALQRGVQGLAKLLLGDAEAARRVLEAGAGDDGRRPAGLQLPLLGLRLHAASACGDAAVVGELAQRLGLRVIPTGQRLFHAYRHLGLGVSALRGGEPLRARVHAEACMTIAGEIRCGLLLELAALLQLQAGIDLGQTGPARAMLPALQDRWSRLGLHRLVAIAHLEAAMLDARAGALERARKAFDGVRRTLPAGEVLRPLNRGQGWLDELDTRLSASTAESHATTHVRIHTVGEFHVEVGGRRIYDRDWKGQRTKSLLIALICEGGHKVPAERLADMLWPDSEGDRALQNLKVALHRLRRLGCAPGEQPVNWVHVKHGHVSLVKGVCWVEGA